MSSVRVLRSQTERLREYETENEKNGESKRESKRK